VTAEGTGLLPGNTSRGHDMEQILGWGKGDEDKTWPAKLPRSVQVIAALSQAYLIANGISVQEAEEWAYAYIDEVSGLEVGAMHLVRNTKAERHFWLSNESGSPISVHIEPWGMELFLLPSIPYEFLTYADDDVEPRVIVEFAGGKQQRFHHDGEAKVSENVRIWPLGRDLLAVSRHGKELVWGSEGNSAWVAALSHPIVDKALSLLADEEDSARKVDRREVEEIFKGWSDLPRHDYLFLLQEHGLIRVEGGTVELTPTGRQFVEQPA
jgi:hypothetical protein